MRTILAALSLTLIICSLQPVRSMAASDRCTLQKGKDKYAVIYVSGLDSTFPEFRENIAKGLSATLLHQIELTTNDDKTNSHIFGCELRYDLWDEIYHVKGFIAGSDKRAERSFKDMKALPDECQHFTTKYSFESVQSVTTYSILNPVSDDQMNKTREWLAEKGIGSDSNRFIGRAVSALIDLKGQKTSLRPCEIEN